MWFLSEYKAHSDGLVFKYWYANPKPIATGLDNNEIRVNLMCTQITSSMNILAEQMVIHFAMLGAVCQFFEITLGEVLS